MPAELRVPVEVKVSTRTVGFTVASAAGSAGAAIADSTPSRRAVIRNLGFRPFEFKIGTGGWFVLGQNQTSTLPVDLATTAVTTRKTYENGIADPSGQLEIEEVGGDMVVGDDNVPLPGTEARRVTNADVVVAVDDVVVSFTNTVGPAAKRNVLLPPKRVNGRILTLLADGGDQAYTVNGNGKTVAMGNATGVNVTELPLTARHVVWSAGLDKWLAW